jgi:NADH-quinone oxidoreductase subunit G
MGNLLGLPGFDQESAEAVRAEALGDTALLADRLNNHSESAVNLMPAGAGLQRVSDVPIYATDPLVRRAASLQLTVDAQAPVVGLPSALWRQLRMEPNAKVLVAQGEAALVMTAVEDNSLAPTAVRISAGHPVTAGLGAMFGAISVEKV